MAQGNLLVFFIQDVVKDTKNISSFRVPSPNVTFCGGSLGLNGLALVLVRRCRAKCILGILVRAGKVKNPLPVEIHEDGNERYGVLVVGGRRKNIHETPIK